jgi:hypothetical protein
MTRDADGHGLTRVDVSGRSVAEVADAVLAAVGIHGR